AEPANSPLSARSVPAPQRRLVVFQKAVDEREEGGHDQYRQQQHADREHGVLSEHADHDAIERRAGYAIEQQRGPEDQAQQGDDERSGTHAFHGAESSRLASSSLGSGRIATALPSSTRVV